MNTIRKTAGAAVIGITSVAAIGLSSAAATATVPSASHHSDSSRADGADSGVVFVQDDNISGNRIHVYERTSDGGLTPSGSYATGGNGGVLTGAVVDNLASQGSLTYDRASGLL